MAAPCHTARPRTDVQQPTCLVSLTKALRVSTILHASYKYLHVYVEV